MGKILTLTGSVRTYVLALLLLSCAKPNGSSLDISLYKKELETWHKQRVQKLLGPIGWVNVSGLFWLKEGINSFGSGAKNDLIFPEGKIAVNAGFFVLRDSVVRMQLLPDITVLSAGVPVPSSSIIFHPDSSKRKMFETGPLQWFVIRRSDKIGIRLRDFESKHLREFTGIERFDPDLNWRVNAKLTVQPGKHITIVNVLGQTYNEPVKGTLTFILNDTEYSLDAIDEEGRLFIIYGDLTNGKSTYGSGRYLYADVPTEDEDVVLDFNKSTNPPCAFTEFATCLLPPRQNVLPIEVTAGEKAYH